MSDTITRTTTVTSATALVRIVHVLWEETDKAVLGLPGTATHTDISGPTDAPATETSLLSTSAKAGIAAGVGLAFIVGAILLWLLLRKRRKPKPPPFEPSTVAELPNDAIKFIPGNQPVELGGPEETKRQQRYEDEAATYNHKVVHELPEHGTFQGSDQRVETTDLGFGGRMQELCKAETSNKMGSRI